jgi:ribonuclease HII
MQSELAAFDLIKSDSGRLLIAGVDEAGRGCLAGPVVASAVILDSSAIPEVLNDSKQLSVKQRNVAYNQIVKSALCWSVFAVSSFDIDSINILQATMLAMSSSINRLVKLPDLVLIDGNKAPASDLKCETVIKGDAKSACIAAASVVAKVTRDRIMDEMHLRYPEYGFSKNKGYGAETHLDALKEYGATPIHRKSYRPVADLLQRSLF